MKKNKMTYGSTAPYFESIPCKPQMESDPLINVAAHLEDDIERMNAAKNIEDVLRAFNTLNGHLTVPVLIRTETLSDKVNKVRNTLRRSCTFDATRSELVEGVTELVNEIKVHVIVDKLSDYAKSHLPETINILQETGII